MNKPEPDPIAAAGQEHFWDLVEPLLAEPEVSRSTMMGLPCLRVHGGFFAACARRSGDLLVKLSAERVDELIESGEAEPFAPAGRRFREWAAVPYARVATWEALVGEARAFVASLPAAPAKGSKGAKAPRVSRKGR